MSNYTIQAQDDSGHWYILGSERDAHSAVYYARDYRKTFPHLALRVVEAITKKVIYIVAPSVSNQLGAKTK